MLTKSKNILIASLPFFLLLSCAKIEKENNIPSPNLYLEDKEIKQCTRNMPTGYINGMISVYKKNYCALKKQNYPFASFAAKDIINNEKQDIIYNYQAVLKVNNISTETEALRLRAVYTMLFELGMRESAGNTTEGFDISQGAKWNDPNNKEYNPDGAEAGLFQNSYDSLSYSLKSNPIFSSLYAWYKHNTPQCQLDIFMVGVRDRKRPLVGEENPEKYHAALDFQRLNKTCPAFAIEYAAIMVRDKNNHYGSLKAHYDARYRERNPKIPPLEWKQACYWLLEKAEENAACPQ